MRRIIIVIIISLIAIGFNASPRHVSAQANDVAYLFAQINVLRQSKGLAPLVINALLASSAFGHSTYLANHPWTNPHVEENGSTPQSRAQAVGYTGKVSENVVGGSTATVQWGFQWWLDSPIHLQNMLYAQWTEIGIGVADGPYGRFFTTDFGDGAAPVATAVPPTSSISSISHNTGAQKSPQLSQASQASQASQPTQPPTRRPTAIPTFTPTITLTPSNTFTPHPSFTPTITRTAPPATATAIVLQVSPQPSDAQTMSQALVAVAITDTPPVQPLLITSAASPTQSGPSDTVRGLLPWLIVLQVGVVGGLVVRSIFRHRR